MSPTVEEIKAAVHEVLEEQRRNFWVEPEQHYLDHKLLTDCRAGRDEWRDNHRFISDMRGSVGQAKRVGIGFIVTAILAGILVAIKKYLGL